MDGSRQPTGEFSLNGVLSLTANEGLRLLADNTGKTDRDIGHEISSCYVDKKYCEFHARVYVQDSRIHCGIAITH